MKSLMAWNYGTWHLSAMLDENATIRIIARKTTKTRGTRHGSYVVLPGGEVLTISMADAKINAHLRSRKMHATMQALTSTAPSPV